MMDRGNISRPYIKSIADTIMVNIMETLAVSEKGGCNSVSLRSPIKRTYRLL